MQSPPKPEVETAKSSDNPVLRLAELMDSLEAIVVEETALVRAGKLRGARALGPKKNELSSLYFKTLEQLKAQKLIARAVPQDVSALKRRHEKLHASLKVNLVVLATAHAVSEGIMRRLSGDLARRACPPVYGASGKTMAPDPRRTQPLALSRTL